MVSSVIRFPVFLYLIECGYYDWGIYDFSYSRYLLFLFMLFCISLLSLRLLPNLPSLAVRLEFVSSFPLNFGFCELSYIL